MFPLKSLSAFNALVWTCFLSGTTWFLQFPYTPSPSASTISAARSSFHSKDHCWWITGHHRHSCPGGSSCEMKQASRFSCLDIKDCWAFCDQIRHSSLPQAKHPQCSKPNGGTLQPEQNPKPRKQHGCRVWFFSCLLNHVKTSQAGTSFLDGRAVGWGRAVGGIKKKQIPKQSQNQLQDISIAIWSLVL